MDVAAAARRRLARLDAPASGDRRARPDARLLARLAPARRSGESRARVPTRACPRAPAPAAGRGRTGLARYSPRVLRPDEHVQHSSPRWVTARSRQFTAGGACAPARAPRARSPGRGGPAIQTCVRRSSRRHAPALPWRRGSAFQEDPSHCAFSAPEGRPRDYVQVRRQLPRTSPGSPGRGRRRRAAVAGGAPPLGGATLPPVVKRGHPRAGRPRWRGAARGNRRSPRRGGRRRVRASPRVVSRARRQRRSTTRCFHVRRTRDGAEVLGEAPSSTRARAWRSRSASSFGTSRRAGTTPAGTRSSCA